MSNRALLSLAFLACAASPEVSAPTHLAKRTTDEDIRSACLRAIDETANALHRVGSSCDPKTLDTLFDRMTRMNEACGRVTADERASSLDRERSRNASHAIFVLEGCSISEVDKAGQEFDDVEQ